MFVFKVFLCQQAEYDNEISSRKHYIAGRQSSIKQTEKSKKNKHGGMGAVDTPHYEIFKYIYIHVCM